MADSEDTDSFSLQDHPRGVGWDSASWISGVSPVFDEEREEGQRELEECCSPETGNTLQGGVPSTLVEQCCRVVGTTWSFEEAVQTSPAPIPDDVQQRIAFWAFPRDEKKIRMYASLANHSTRVFQEAEHLLRKGRLQKMYQIGFQLCTKFSYKEHQRGLLQANITFDRCSITSCSCTCEARTPWCSHVVAACLARVRYPLRTEIRVPLSGSLMHLDRIQLQKFVQYLIARASGDLLFDAQELLDEFHLPESEVNVHSGAPDVTGGGASGEQARWLLDTSSLQSVLQELASNLLLDSTFPFAPVNTEVLPRTVEIFHKMVAVQSYRKSPAFHIDYISMLTHLLQEKDANAFTLVRAASQALVNKLSLAQRSVLVLESLVCAMVDDLSLLWMLTSLTLSSDGKNIASSLVEFRSQLSHQQAIPDYIHHLLDDPVAFVSSLLQRCSLPASQEETTSPHSRETTPSAPPDIADWPVEHSGAPLPNEHTDTHFSSGTLGQCLRGHLQHSLPPTSPFLSSEMNLATTSLSACIAILTYLDVNNRREEGCILAEAVATWLFPPNGDNHSENACQDDSDSCPENHDTSASKVCRDYRSLLQLILLLLKILQRNVLSALCAIKTLFLSARSLLPTPLEVLLIKYEGEILKGIELHLAARESVDDTLLTFAQRVAEGMLSTVDEPLPPYHGVQAVYSILTHERKPGDPLFRLAHTLVLHVIKTYPITKLPISCDTNNEMFRLCLWVRLKSLLSKVLHTSDPYVGKEVTSALEAVFPKPVNFTTSVTRNAGRGGAIHTAPGSIQYSHPPLHINDESSTTIEEAQLSPRVPSLAQFDDPGRKMENELNVGYLTHPLVSSTDTYCLQKLVEELHAVKKGVTGIEKLDLLELYLLSLRTKNYLNPHWGYLQEDANCISRLSSLVIEVGEPAVLVLYHKWPLCLTPWAVVYTVQETLRHSAPKAFSTAAICHILKSLLHSAGNMDSHSLLSTLEICCKGGSRHAVEAMDILMQMPQKTNAKSDPFFFLANHMYQLYQRAKTRDSAAENTGQQTISQCPENWEEDEDDSKDQPSPRSSSILGMPPSLLGSIPVKLSQNSNNDPQSLPQTQNQSTESSVYTRLSVFLHSPHAFQQQKAGTIPVAQEYLLRAFAAGMRAMKALIDRGPVWGDTDILAPEYASGVKTVVAVACTMGNEQIMQLLKVLPTAVTSPQVLQESALNIAQHLSQNHPHQLEIQLRNEPIAGILREAMHQFANCVGRKLACGPKCYGADVVELLKEMQETAYYLPTGQEDFSKFLSSLLQEHRSKKLRKLITGSFPDYIEGCRVRGVHQPNTSPDSPLCLMAQGEMWDD